MARLPLMGPGPSAALQLYDEIDVKSINLGVLPPDAVLACFSHPS